MAKRKGITLQEAERRLNAGYEYSSDVWVEVI